MTERRGPIPGKAQAGNALRYDPACGRTYRGNVYLQPPLDAFVAELVPTIRRPQALSFTLPPYLAARLTAAAAASGGKSASGVVQELLAQQATSLVGMRFRSARQLVEHLLDQLPPVGEDPSASRQLTLPTTSVESAA